MTRSNSATVRVLLYSCPPGQPYLNFRLIFEDHYEKDITVDAEAIRAYGGASDRAIIADQAMLYFESLGQQIENLQLVFL